MSLVVLVILAVVWAVFLLPQLFRARAERSTDSIGAFRHQLSVLERTTPAGAASVTRLRPAHRPQAPSAIPPSARPVRPARPGISPRHHAGRALARKRRRDVLCGLLVAMGATLVLSLIPALRSMLFVHVVLDGLFAAYVGLLVRARNLATERDLKVRFLPSAAPQPQLLLRRSAN